MKEIRNSSPPTFTTETAKAHGAGSVRVAACRADHGALRSVFRRRRSTPASYPDALAVAFRSQRAIVCCLSTSAVHELTDGLPRFWTSDDHPSENL